MDEFDKHRAEIASLADARIETINGIILPFSKSIAPHVGARTETKQKFAYFSFEIGQASFFVVFLNFFFAHATLNLLKKKGDENSDGRI